MHPEVPLPFLPAACPQRVSVAPMTCCDVSMCNSHCGPQSKALLTEAGIPRTELVSRETVEEDTGGQMHFQALCLKQGSLLPNSVAFACPVTPGCIRHQALCSLPKPINPGWTFKRVSSRSPWVLCAHTANGIQPSTDSGPAAGYSHEPHSYHFL